MSNWNNGVIMIAIFALVCLVLIGVLVNFMMGGKKNTPENDTDSD
ncbi:hypothetical protein [Hanstruepera flava]|nr:hypothetical protein [Hanstruepera flava]